MPTMARLRTLFVPACISVLFLVAAGWYYSFWIPARHRYLDDRNFRVLRTLSEQIRLSVDNFDRMLDNAADAGTGRSRIVSSGHGAEVVVDDSRIADSTPSSEARRGYTPTFKNRGQNFIPATPAGQQQKNRRLTL